MKQKQDKETMYSRVLVLKTHLNLDQNEFCAKAKISTRTFHAIKAEDKGIRLRTFSNIAENLGVNPDWLIKGEGEMMRVETTDQNTTLLQDALAEMKIQFAKQNEMINKLTTIIMNLSGPGNEKATNFLSAFNDAALNIDINPSKWALKKVV